MLLDFLKKKKNQAMKRKRYPQLTFHSKSSKGSFRGHVISKAVPTRKETKRKSVHMLDKEIKKKEHTYPCVKESKSKSVPKENKTVNQIGKSYD